MRIDSNAFLLLLLRSNNEVTREVAARLQDELSERRVKAVIEWASVDREPGPENHAFTSLADAIRETAREAGGRSRRVTH